jgi:hypothetical protein
MLQEPFGEGTVPTLQNGDPHRGCRGRGGGEETEGHSCSVVRGCLPMPIGGRSGFLQSLACIALF